jgi:dethiobiotin synthetase
MVVGVRLGCLNHPLLTSLAIRARGLKLVGWIANSIDPAMMCQDENIGTLERQLSAPRIARMRWGHADSPEWSSIDAIEAGANFSSRRDPC